MFTTLCLLALQGPTVALASTSADSRLPQDPIVWDETLIRREQGPIGAKVYFDHQAWLAMLGDLDGDDVADAPGDLDALAWMPRGSGLGPGPLDWLFSTTTGLGGQADGDLLRLVEGQGLQVEVSEGEFLSALQPSSGSFDLDAAAWRAPDEFWISVGDRLQGTVLGTIEDGDVLVYDRSQQSIRREYSEADMQAMVDAATGSSNAIGDVLALAFFPPTGELCFTVQSPTAADATVYGVGNGGRLINAWDENDWGFQVSTELDALCFVPGGIPQPPIVGTDLPTASPASLVRFAVKHGTPNAIAEGVMARQVGYREYAGHGVGFLFMSQHDPRFRQLIRKGHTHANLLDGSGSLTFQWRTPHLPHSLPWLDLYVQVLDFGGGGWSPPIVLRVQ